MYCLRIFVAVCVALLLGAGSAMAADSGHLPWGNFLLRVLNLAVVCWIIWHFAGKLIKKMLSGHRAGIVSEMDDLARQKREAEIHLSDIERKVADVEAEYNALLAEGQAQAMALKEGIIAEAHRQAEAILEQAKRSAEQEGKSEVAIIRAQLADEIIAAVEKKLAGHIDTEKHHELINKSLSKVVLQ